MVQPSSGLRWPLFAAAPIGWVCQVLPPSLETATWSCAGAARPFSWPAKLAQQMYALPKKGLEAALSAHTCSLSEKVVDDWCDTITGCFQAAMLPAAADWTSSVLDTAMASNPLKAASDRVAPKLEV